MFESSPRQGYFIRFSFQSVSKGKPEHVFCGPNSTTEVQCPNCNKDFLLLLSIDTTDDRLNLRSIPFDRLALYFCWTCDISQAPFYYELNSNGVVTLIKWKKGSQQMDFPYKNYPLYFPKREVILEPIPDDLQLIISGLNSENIDEWEITQTHPEICRPRLQIGGEPYLVQKHYGDYLQCPKCDKQMPFFATICDDAVNAKFTENEFVQVLFHFCRECLVIGALQICD